MSAVDFNTRQRTKQDARLYISSKVATIISLNASSMQIAVGMACERYLHGCQVFIDDLALMRHDAMMIKENLAQHRRDIPKHKQSGNVVMRLYLNQDVYDTIYYRAEAENRSCGETLEYYLMQNERFKSDFELLESSLKRLKGVIGVKDVEE